ncbi:MAG: hypothetical protein QN210_12170 [Armatimonadota bacterium]|nr:hypothetical protein [Armatimonadota bacterium]MDR7471197.1 hypothetical protein [Armatimonadota bacterium]MDR7561897.1 hypothetical protein [Armatimonadota bacterium]MDR7587040.1 hypothetical protein [Armatimonadota bacterium]MDR7613153.1 hypothetical protein [Armatimonadota bacterium]
MRIGRTPGRRRRSREGAVIRLGDLLYYGLGGLFYLVPRVLYEISAPHARRYDHRPATLIVTNHKRDLDSVILPPTLFFNGVWPKRPIWFAGREDMFWRGFLATFEVVPRPLRRLLYEMDLRAVLGALRILPVRRFPERTLEEALREVQAVWGDLPAAQVLAAEEARPWIDRYGPDVRLSRLLAWPHRDAWRRPATLAAFAPPWRPRLSALWRRVVEDQIRALAAVLDAGDVLYLAPEGVISPDGRLHAFRSGFRRILQTVRRPVRVVPACIAYDFMRRGRLRVFIGVGEAMVAGGDPEEVVARTRRAVAALHTLSCTQVAGGLLWQRLSAGEAAVNLDAFADAVASAARRLAARGLRVDPALLVCPRDRVRTWADFLRGTPYAAVEGDTLRVDPGWVHHAPPTHWQNPIRYAANEMASVEEILSPPGAGARPP